MFMRLVSTSTPVPLTLSAVACVACVGCVVSCIPATNPCDPAAPIEVQAAGTRISGRVVDQDGDARPGVLVSVVGRAETIASGADGSFVLENLPPADAYELQALPSAPLVGGRTSTGALSCRGAIEDVQVVIVEPPTSPEVEIARASGEQRLFVAFGAAGDAEDFGNLASFFESESEDVYREPATVVAACDAAASTSKIAYRAQVRAPFGAWRDAVLAPFPWVLPKAEDLEQLYTNRIDDLCAAAACAQFSYLDSTLANPNARCIDVVGIKNDEDVVNGGGPPFKLLEPFGSYQVRIVAELKTPDALRTQFVLPERVEAEASASGLQMTLVPTALLPVVDETGLPREVGNIAGLVATAGGRFALVEDDELAVIGQGRDTLSQEAQDAVGGGTGSAEGADAPQDAYGVDAVANANVAGDFTEGATVPVQPLAILTAGDWVRVIRRGDDGSASIEKVYVGESAAANESGPDEAERQQNAEAPELRIDPAGDALRAFEYMVPEEGLADAGAAPKDAYVLLYGSAFVLAEQAPVEELELDYFAELATDAPGGEITDTAWAAPVADGGEGEGEGEGEPAPVAPSALDGAGCNTLQASATTTGASSVETFDGGDGVRANVNVCYDLGAGLQDDAIDLRDVAVLDDLAGVRRSHVMSDARGDRVFVASKADLFCSDCATSGVRSLAAEIDEVPVGREPLGLLRTRLLECSPDNRTESSRPVVLVANHGSGDLSVLEQLGDESRGDTRETFVVPLSALPVSFLDDPDGPTCDDPFVWVVADDGRVIPVDMRGEPTAPFCGTGTCEVGTRGRGSVGAVARRIGDGALTAKSRALVGGAGVLGELGYFRPKALRGGAFVDPNDIAGGGSSEPVDGSGESPPEGPPPDG